MNKAVKYAHIYKPTMLDSASSQKYMIVNQAQSTDPTDSTVNKNLLIGNTLYHTRLNGIDSITLNDDFRGIIEILCSSDTEIPDLELSHIVFAVWFNLEAKRYLLTALGQYSSSSYTNDLQTFRSSSENNRLCIRLFDIPESCLTNLAEKLQVSGLPNATVLLPDDSIA